MRGLLPFGDASHYSIQGAAADPDLETYLQSILKNRLQDDTDTPRGDDSADEAARREAYREQSIRDDLLRAMQAKGYYDADITYTDDPEAPRTGQYDVTPGAQYRIASVTVEPAAFAAFLTDPAAAEGAILAAAPVLQAQKNLAASIQEDRCYFSLRVANAVILDRDRHEAALTFHVEAGAEGHFGPVTFTGQERVKTSYLRKLIPWKPGDCYRQEKVEALKRTLMESGLFSKADAILPATPDADGTVPITVEVGERAPRTLRAGLTYYTDEGPGAQFGWEHRNFFGAAEKLSAALGLSTLKQTLDVTLKKPFFMRKDQTLSLNTALRRQDTDAYDETGMDLGATISRNFSRRLSGATGAALTLTWIEEENTLRNDDNFYALLSLPQSVTYDSRSDKLNPDGGIVLTTALTPFFDIAGQSDPFLKAQAGASAYYAFDEDSRYILALRAGLGSILGSGRFDIPPTERFYAGGGGSVRGFGYQEVGPKDADGNPLGGRSVATASTEFRLRFTDKIGAVAFVDAGTVSEESWPEMRDVAVGAGVGARYYTGFGPLRVDVATPLTQKDDLDQNYQLYISIGQAF